MSNIYTSVDLIRKFLQKHQTTPAQHEFLHQCIDPLIYLGATLEKEDIVNFYLHIERELNETPSVDFVNLHSNLAYKTMLKKVLKNIEVIHNKQNEIENFVSQKPDEFVKLNTLDLIFKETEAKYHGQIILPVKQLLDARLGGSKGECFGYVTEWALAMLHDKHPFGINDKYGPLFKPIKFNSAVGRKYPTLNHGAVLTPEISAYQKHQLKLNKYFKNAPDALLNKTVISSSMMPEFYGSTKLIAEELIAKTHAKDKAVCYLNLHGFMSGHAIGFCKKDNKYHFFDSNSAWYTFNSAKDFKRWLPFYMQKMSYDQAMLEKEILTLKLRKPDQPELSANMKRLLSVVALPVRIPLTSVYLGYQIFYRGGIYAFNKLEQLQNKYLSPSDPNAIQQDAEDNNYPSYNNSYKKISAYLDVELKGHLPDNNFVNKENKSSVDVPWEISPYLNVELKEPLPDSKVINNENNSVVDVAQEVQSTNQKCYIR